MRRHGCLVALRPHPYAQRGMVRYILEEIYLKYRKGEDKLQSGSIQYFPKLALKFNILYLYFTMEVTAKRVLVFIE